MVDDPSEYTDQLLSDPKLKRQAEAELKRRLKRREAAEVSGEVAEAPEELTLAACVADQERERLFRLIEELVKWKNTTNETVLQQARDEIWASWRRTCAANADHPQAGELFDRHKLPAFHDPFAGGGALPLEAQRLGLEAWASDLNPVAVLINKAMIEIPPKFAGWEPVNPEWRQMPAAQKMGREWKGAQGLAEDVRYYGQWMRDEAEKRIGHLYPKVKVTAEMAAERPDLKAYLNRELTVIAWIWARTVKSPNPAFSHVDVPLASTFMLSTKKGKEAYVEPVLEGDSYRFTVKVGKPKDASVTEAGTSAGKRAGFKCLMSGVPIRYSYIREQGQAGNLRSILMAIVLEGDRGRVYLRPTEDAEHIARSARPEWSPDVQLHGKCRVNVSNYGMDVFGDLFTPRQLVALNTFSDLVAEARERVLQDASKNGLPNDNVPLEQGGKGARAYAEAVSVYLGFVVDRIADYNSALTTWKASGQQVMQTLKKQAIPMVWDFPESNVFAGKGITWKNAVDIMSSSITKIGVRSWIPKGAVFQGNAVTNIYNGVVMSTDPPYYDNISYAEISDFFYVFLRRNLRSVFPSLLSTLSSPKNDELIVSTVKIASRGDADRQFMQSMSQTLISIKNGMHPGYPITIYYAYKQSETSTSGSFSTGWDVFLQAVCDSGYRITGTWPLQTEGTTRQQANGNNSLSISIVLVCRKKELDAPSILRKSFRAELKPELASAVCRLQKGNIAPVDLAQAAIGPGMAVYTRYERVLDAAGEALSVRQALALINEVLDETLAEQEGDFDADSRLALAWFEQYGFEEGPFGVAETLSKAKNSSVAGLEEAKVWKAGKGKVCLLRPEHLDAKWDPSSDKRLTVWEMVHHLLRALSEGESVAAHLLAKLGPQGETARELAYRLYSLCERKKWAKEALGYNSLVQSWPELQRLAEQVAVPEQGSFL